MESVSRRDFFAATADVSWIKADTKIEYIAMKSGIETIEVKATPDQVVQFYLKAEIAWRWRYADLMIKGLDPQIDGKINEKTSLKEIKTSAVSVSS